jgi:hypothetical protein
VVRYITKEFLQLHATSSQIFYRLHLEHPHLSLSIDTISRVCDDLLKLKAFRIDQRTKEVIHTNNAIILGLDGQDPGADNDSLWLFIDLLSGRILATMTFESLSHEPFHKYIEELLQYYPVKVLGWVSDKQNVITTCHDLYYPEIHHKYCQFHFLTHLWDHLECLDSNIYMSLKQMIGRLYIQMTTNSVKFDEIGIQLIK